MTEAGLYRCPACGAPADQAARHCAFCISPIATLRCVQCFHMNPPSAQHCSGCGRELGIESLEALSETQCPSCRIALARFDANSGLLFDCSSCGGQFVEHQLLRALLERRDVVGRAHLGVPITQRPSSPVKVSYRPCPSCGALMHRKNFGSRSGIIVDVCTRHGVWFDPGELPGVLAFVETGGLERERAADLAAERAAAVERRSLPSQSMSKDVRFEPTELSIVEDLIDYVLAALRK